MRANGGFAGSYAKIILSTKRLEFLNPRVLEFSPEFTFQDIYVPNGQLAGHVVPPEPIQQAFQHGTWELANADWEPDFPTSAKNLRWFFEKGNEINPDILSIINLSTIKQILNIVGSFPVPEYSANLTPDNLYLFLQGKTETNFFPGSTQKKDTLTAVGLALIKKAQGLSLLQKYRIAHILYTDLVNQNIMIHSNNLSFQTLLEQKKLAGVLSPGAFDTYSLVETNLGANKANQFVTRSTTHQISLAGQNLRHEVTVKLINSSPEANPNPPIHYGGNYVAYFRFYVPAEAKDISLTWSDATSSATPSTQISPKYGLSEIGFWQTTPAGAESTIKLSYGLFLPLHSRYSLSLLKQHGLISSPQTINISGKALSTLLRNDFYYSSNKKTGD